MQRIILFLLMTVLSTTLASAQDNQKADSKERNQFSIKVEPFYGSYMNHSFHFNKFRPFAPKGINFGFELPSLQTRPWQQYMGNPTWGIGLSVIDFGHAMMGEAVSMYPYLLIPAVRSNHFNLQFKVAGGLGLVTEHWYTLDVDPDNYNYYSPDVNSIFGCYLNAYLSATVNVNVPITKSVALNGEAGYFHMSNGRTCMPNLGLDALYAGLGVITTFNAQNKKEPVQFPDLPYKWSLNITGAAGAHRAWMYYPLYLISSFHTGAVYSVNNWYGVGVGLDAFYNGAINSGTGRSLYCNGEIERVDENGNEYFDPCNTCDGVYTFKDKVRAGIALNNEFRFGVVTAMVDWGVYFYNPSRNHYYDWHKANFENGGAGKRELFYKSSGAGSEETFHYIRFGMKFRLTDNLYFQTSAKTHLQICEYLEFGVGYQIPFLKKGLRKGNEKIFHYKKGWWNNL